MPKEWSFSLLHVHVCPPVRNSLLQITEDREKEMRQDLDDLHGRHVELKRKFRTLYLAYRQLR